MFYLCTGNDRSWALCLFCPALVQEEVDVLGSWSKEYFESWNVSTVVTKEEYHHYCTSLGFGLPNVGVSENYNLSSAQKKLLL